MKTTLFAIVGLLVALGGGLAYAAIPGDNGVINACYRVADDDRKGDLRVVSNPTACGNQEAPLSWSQVARPGPRAYKASAARKENKAHRDLPSRRPTRSPSRSPKASISVAAWIQPVPNSAAFASSARPGSS
jgi:hypothetical protein